MTLGRSHLVTSHATSGAQSPDCVWWRGL